MVIVKGLDTVNFVMKSFMVLFIIKIFSEIIFSKSLKTFRKEYDVSLFRVRFKDIKLLGEVIPLVLKALLSALSKLLLQSVKLSAAYWLISKV